MKRKTLISSFICLILLVSLVQTAAALTEFGRNPFHQSPLTSDKEMKALFAERQDDIRNGLTRAGMPEIYEPLMIQLPRATVRTVSYPKGTRLQWMFFRKNGTGPVRIDKDVLWESEQPFSGYEFQIDFKGSRYTFVVPLACSNLALSDVGPIPPVVVPPPPAPAPEPEPEPVPEPPPVAEVLPYTGTIDTGYLCQLDPANHLFLRGGFHYELNKDVTLLALFGVAPKIGGGRDSKTAFIFDAIANYHFGRAFTGFGIGGWLSGGDKDLDTEDDGLDLIFDLGYEFYEKPGTGKVLGFVEVRSAIDEISDFSDYGRVGAGLRFVF
ncbi:MAG: hypothetical protein CSA26_03205 [Desulfobacterales bacterium]|nr:MAG: hypothetical protein CSA26_03205 [Desulfobacterales bacterium]